MKAKLVLLAALTVLGCRARPRWEPPRQPQPEAAAGPNLVRNAGFEEVRRGRPASWSGPTTVFRLDGQAARTGRWSLRCTARGPRSYLLWNQPLDLEPGRRYELRAWVRTAGLRGHDSGAGVLLQWFGADGRRLGGFAPPGRAGETPQWVEIGGVTKTIPAEAVRCTISCSVRPRVTGTAWWDDLSVRRVPERPMQSLLIRPSYRGWVLDDGPSHAELRVRLEWDDLPGGAPGHRLTLRLTPAEGDTVLAQRVFEPAPAGEARLRLPLGGLAPGSYRLQLDLQSVRTGRPVQSQAYRLRRRGGPSRRCYVDRHNRLIADGRPFFPLGMYFESLTADDLATYAEGPFNCVIPYRPPSREQMDLAARHGLKVIYSIKDFYHGVKGCLSFIESPADEEPAVRKWVRRFRDHPALLAWYLNDELPVSLLPRLEAHQRWVEEEDPGHPTWTVLYQVHDVARYARSFDVIGTDPYPIPDRPVGMAGQWTRKTREAVADARAVWMVPQVFNWGHYRKDLRAAGTARPPTAEEIRSMTWQCLVAGADGILFYSWFDLQRDQARPFPKGWAIVRRVAAEVAQMAPVLLSVEPAPELTVLAPPAVRWTVRRHRGEVYLFLVNDARQAAAATVRFPTPPRRVTLDGRAVPLAAGAALRAALPPLGVRIYRAAM